MNNLVLTLIGPDRPGLVESVAQVIAAHDGNWLESRMAHLAGKFAGILRAEVPVDRTDAVIDALHKLETRGLKVVVESATPASAPAPAPDAAERSMDLELVGLDRPGIVREISQLLAQHEVNVDELTTDRTSAPMSGEMLFRARARIRMPAAFDLGRLRAGLERVASDLMVEIHLVEPAPGSSQSPARRG
jgi:glycine cleavage system regulatory protein